MTDQAAFRIADGWIGSGFWKFAYVTNDRELAIRHCRDRLGIEEFDSFEPTFDVVMADGRSGLVRTKAAFSVGRHITVELVEPVEGLTDLWAEPLRGARDFTMVLHHTGVFVDDLKAVKRSAQNIGLQTVLESGPQSGMPFVYYAPPDIGFYVELMESDGAWLAELQQRALPPLP